MNFPQHNLIDSASRIKKSLQFQKIMFSSLVMTIGKQRFVCKVSLVSQIRIIELSRSRTFSHLSQKSGCCYGTEDIRCGALTRPV